MQEVFYEETAVSRNAKSEKRKFYFISVASILFYALIPIWVFVFMSSYSLNSNLFVAILIGVLPIVILLFSAIMLGKLKNKFCLDYDYTFVSGTIRLSQVIKNTRRKFLLEFDARDIEKIGKFGSQTFLRYSASPVNKMIFTSNETPADDKDFYYFVVNSEGEKKLLTFECSERFILNVLRFANSMILDDEFKKELTQHKK